MKSRVVRVQRFKDPMFYTYGIIGADSPKSFGPIGIGGEGNEVFTINYRNIAAVVSPTSREMFEPTEQNALDHERVISHVMDACAIIPMSFGTVLRSENAILRMLRVGYEEFVQILQQISGKIELGLKVSWRKEAFAKVLEEIDKTSERLRGLKARLRKGSVDSYGTMIAAGEIVEAAIAERNEDYVSQIVEALKPYAVASRINTIVGERMILNASFLVEKDKEADFDARVNEVAARFGDILEFQYTGPWPPYNFVDVKFRTAG
ncbi:MAG: GvpL/GvpF family gas vesicle protein [Firmicutes bacterium]|nr:GvpL/GvpF family gas vesicle protein [Bacillota bacterium]